MHWVLFQSCVVSLAKYIDLALVDCWGVYLGLPDCCPRRPLCVLHGDYAQLSQTLVTTVMTLLDNDPGTSTHGLRAMLQEAYPAANSISLLDIFNTKVRVGLLREEMTANGSLGKTKLTFTHPFKGLEHKDGAIIDNASKQVHSIIQSVLTSTVEGWKLISMQQKIHKKEPGFTYQVARDNNGCPIGVCWMTPQMRANYELFGSYISIDAMKRQTNSLHWPYVAPVVLDKKKSVAVIAKSLVCQECLESFEFVLNAVFQMAPKCKKKDVLLLASDCFVNA